MEKMKKVKNFLSKLQIKGFIAGILLMVMIISTLAVAGVPTMTNRNVNVVFADYNVTIDGAPFAARDAQENIIELFNKDGWIFAPFEHIAEALGMNIAWFGATHTLALTTPVPRVVREMPARVNLRHVEGASNIFERSPGTGVNRPEYADSVLVGGRTFTDVVHFYSSNGETFTHHNLNGEFTTVSGYALRVDGRGGSARPATLRIIGDGRLLHTVELGLGDLSVPFSVPVLGIRVLRIEGTFVTSSGAPHAVQVFLQ